MFKETPLQKCRFQLFTIFNILGSACYIYEIYYDNLIFWMGIYNITNLFFGFCAILFPFLNRLLHLILCIKLILFGVKSRRKTVKPELIDQTLIGLNLYHISKLLYFNQTNNSSKKVLLAISVKEFVLKSMQIILKVVLIASIFNKECAENMDVMIIGIVVNSISLMQLISYIIITLVAGRKNLQIISTYHDLYTYWNEKSFEVVITDKNGEYMLKNLNNFIHSQQRKIRSINISFQKVSG